MRRREKDAFSIQAGNGDRRVGLRFPIALDVRYAIDGRHMHEEGYGQTVDLSSSGVGFQADKALKAGQYIRMTVAWPARLDGNVSLQLLLVGRVVRTNGMFAALTLRNYTFRTRGVALASSRNYFVDSSPSWE